MKKFLLAFLLLGGAPLLAQENELQAEAVKAFQAGDYATAKSLFESLLDTDPRNPSAQNYLRIIAHREKGLSGIEGALSKIIVPKVELKNTSVQESVAFLSQRVKELSDGKQALNVVWLTPPDLNTKVNLSLQNVPATEVLRYITDACNLKVEYEPYAVKIKPADAQASAAPVTAPPTQ